MSALYSLFEKSTGRRATTACWLSIESAEASLGRIRRTASTVRPDIDPDDLEVRELDR